MTSAYTDAAVEDLAAIIRDTAEPYGHYALARRILDLGWRQVWTADGDHLYVSTGCMHGDHDYCNATTGRAGAKSPAQCKHCGAPCRCTECGHRQDQ